MLDDRVRAVLERLQREDADERERGLPAAERSRAVTPTTGQFLFALVVPQVDCEVLEIGASRGYSTLWLAAGVRHLGGRVLSLESDPAKVAAWRANIAEAGLEEGTELIEGDAKQTVPVIADNVLSHHNALGAYVQARKSDPTVESVTVPLDRGLELSVILRGDLSAD